MLLPNFFIAKSLIKGFRNATIQAKVKGVVELYAIIGSDWEHPPISRYGGKGDFGFQFEFNSNLPIPDNFFTGSSFSLYSIGLIDVIKGFDVEYETFDATLIDKKKGIEQVDSHKVFHLLSEFSIIDWEKTIHDKFSYFKSIALNEDRVKSAPAFFVNSETRNYHFMREDLKEAIEAAGLTGFSFQTLDEFARTSRGLK